MNTALPMVSKFFSREYENDINSKMLYYDFVFPLADVSDYVSHLLTIDISFFLESLIQSSSATELNSSMIFQFSNFDDCSSSICRKLKEIGNPGVTCIQAGKLLLPPDKVRNDLAYRKYGENHVKTAVGLHLMYELDKVYFLSCIGYIFNDLPVADRQRLLTRLVLRNNLIAQLIKHAIEHEFSVRSLLHFLADSTYKRRASNISRILRLLSDSTEHDFSSIITNILL